MSQPQEVNDNISELADNIFPESSNDTASGSPMQIADSLPMEPHDLSKIDAREIIEEDTFSDAGIEEQDVSIDRHASPSAEMDSGVPVDPTTSSPRTPKKKAKTRNKKAKVDDKGTQYLGDKVYRLFFVPNC